MSAGRYGAADTPDPFLIAAPCRQGTFGTESRTKVVRHGIPIQQGTAYPGRMVR
jgi:hypothetical protein